MDIEMFIRDSVACHCRDSATRNFPAQLKEHVVWLAAWTLRNIWQYLRGNWLSNRVFDTYDAIIDAACEAWRKLIADP